MSLHIPFAAQGRPLDAIFREGSQIKDEEREKWPFGAEILAYPRYILLPASASNIYVLGRAARIDPRRMLQMLAQIVSGQ